MIKAEHEYLRKQLVKHIAGGEAFTPLMDLLKEIHFEDVGKVPEGLPYSIWQQLYHIRFAQYDILEFSRNPHYRPQKWPDDYWPPNSAPENQEEWIGVVNLYQQERNEFIKLIEATENDLFEPFVHGNGQTLFREAMLIVEHTSYHTGEILVIMRILGIHR